MLITVDPEYPNMKRVANAARILRAGGLLAYPTDTTYGIGADPFQPKAVALLFNETSRSPKKPASLLCADLKMIGHYAVISDRIFRAMRRTLPGPYTFILPAKNTVPRGMHGKRREVGIRMPEHPIVQALIAALGTPILNLSARDPENHYLDDAREIEALWGERISAVLDCGPITPQESTVIDLIEDTPVLLREGLGDPAPYLS
ncbi:MAG TPA: threonylcarbamoyl-AMP synthase [Bdellovibrionales bacterium]|nr:MAG: threonylcarbamoyl-AMP synthase [Bdellovibrionales bacterium GWB1_52_6]OFZ04855.1 MAG: threonylcarbamoyl-AMP synthase [Bdellovibrionales bacterium GWA1_52_35]OFZ38330.1 MAG: threonylcarbamoyl-AMP synthase [Bdellovibrionales bacterium GWC1_52_8]HAR44402.1 threonylcarbamoyl-AMP synthase [Bdellovibrionales bacterium]HCM38941.1 threonylcarbamoyl-AMP synthase [Bdellovibrionales bacterium]